ncbi:hypothetical protein [Paraburkholderia caffeinilytica]|uniref:hypothetical protein n=1 Tax=Paraburkholderia caffeinilytica TaxID=1761016 RepID=UPI0013BE9F07|nr:hypothetical protein [Paraburkholderia caffeinilytica]
MEVFHLARFARAFFFCARLCAINPAAKLPRNSGENKKGEPVEEFAFVFMRGLARAVMLAAMSMQAVCTPCSTRQCAPGFTFTSTLPAQP